MLTEIYYFSGTGNSLYAAGQIQARLPDSRLIPIVGAMKDHSYLANSECVGFVFPVHALNVPIVVRKFIREMDLSSAKYIFAVATRAGTPFPGTVVLENLLKKKKKKLDALFIINMFMNDPREENYKCPESSEILDFKSHTDKQLDHIQNVILNQAQYHEKDTGVKMPLPFKSIIEPIMVKLILGAMSFAEFSGGVNYFYSTPECTQCGICEKVCLSGKIKMVDKKPVWQKKVMCYMCFACINYCPAHAIEIEDIPVVKSHTRENGRYSHPFAAALDIVRQKSKSI